MAKVNLWLPAEPDLETILSCYPHPLEALADGNIPAVIIRRAFKPEHCSALVKRFYQLGLLYDPRSENSENADKTPRLDIGSSLGNRAANREAFFEHAAETHKLFTTLFEGYDDPVKLIYDTISAMAADKRVMVGREADGRLYGPAIFRTYYEKVGHKPHFDSVSKRSKLFNYAVSRFEKQFAGVLCFQNSDNDGGSVQSCIYRRQWTSDLQEYLQNDTFHQYADAHSIDRVQTDLKVGDLYFFFSENIHEVPPVKGDIPRIVLAVFFGMSKDDEEIFVWS